MNSINDLLALVFIWKDTGRFDVITIYYSDGQRKRRGFR